MTLSLADNLQASPAAIRAQKEARRGRPQATVLRFFVASSSDVRAEREAVSRAVEKLHGRIGYDFRIDVVKWENYDTPDWQPPQEAVFGNTRFDDIDLFLGIFWWKVGTPTGTYDAEGREYPGGTFAELERAKALRAEGRVKRIMLYFCDRPLPPEGDAAQHEQIEALRRELESGQARGFYNRYVTVEEFERKVMDHLQAALMDFAPERRGLTPASELVAKLCDRVDQETDFHEFFLDGQMEEPGRPQACILWGEEGEGHGSFVERLTTSWLKRWATQRWGDAEGTVPDYQPDWPEGSSLEVLKRRVPRMLFGQFDEFFDGPDLSAAALTRLPGFRRARLVVLHHNVYLTEWKPPAGELIRWYLDEYWSGLPDDRERPAVLIFLKLIYRGALRGGDGPDEARQQSREARAQLARDLEALCAAHPTGARRILLPELEPVRAHHVQAWLQKHGQVAPEERARELARELFHAQGTVLESRSMDEIENELRNLIPRLPSL